MGIVSPDKVTEIIDNTLLPYRGKIRYVTESENNRNQTKQAKSRENEIEENGI